MRSPHMLTNSTPNQNFLHFLTLTKPPLFSSLSPVPRIQSFSIFINLIQQRRVCSSFASRNSNPMGAEGKVYNLAQVSEHNSPKDCWLVIEGKVYDVTKFLEDHPGGDEVLLSATGKDATDDFEDVGHSSSARAMLDEMYVGDIDTATIPTKTKYTPPKQPQYNQDKTPEFIIKILQFLVPLMILGLAFAVRFYTKAT